MLIGSKATKNKGYAHYRVAPFKNLKLLGGANPTQQNCDIIYLFMYLFKVIVDDNLPNIIQYNYQSRLVRTTIECHANTSCKTSLRVTSPVASIKEGT